jgi:hypothetical protein
LSTTIKQQLTFFGRVQQQQQRRLDKRGQLPSPPSSFPRFFYLFTRADEFIYILLLLYLTERELLLLP